MSSNIEVVKRELFSLTNDLSEEKTPSLANEDTGAAYTLVVVAKSCEN